MENKCASCNNIEKGMEEEPCVSCTHIGGSLPPWADDHWELDPTKIVTPRGGVKNCDTCKHDITLRHDSICLSCIGEWGCPRWESNGTRKAATPEPMSKPGERDVLPEVIKDFEARDTVGLEKYGTTLQTFNGRNALNDALQEVMDLVMYLKQVTMEHESDSLENKIVKWATDRGLYEKATYGSQLSKLSEEIEEWVDEIESGDRVAEALELGDMYVVLVNIAKVRGFSLEDCGQLAYDKIKDRTGHMENGTFVKDDIK